MNSVEQSRSVTNTAPGRGFDRLAKSCALILGLIAGATRSHAVSLTWTNGSDVWASMTAWQTNLYTAYTNDLTGGITNSVTNSFCEGVLPPGSIIVSNCNGGGTGGFPSGGDDVAFTNDTGYTVSFSSAPATIANGYFNAHAGTVTLDVGAQTWSVTGSFRVAQSSGTTASVAQISGTVSAPGVFVIGDNGVGRYSLSGGALSALGIWLGNSTNGTGTLTISGSGTLILGTSGTISVGRVAGTSGNSLIFSNNISITGGTITLGGNVDAVNNTIQVLPGAFIEMFSGAALSRISVGGHFNTLVVNGATINDAGTVLVGTSGGYQNTMILTNGATLISGGGNPRIGNGDGTYGNTVIVTGSNTVWDPSVESAHQILLGAAGFSSNNTLLVKDGGLVTNCTLRIGDSAAGPPVKGGNFNGVIVSNGGKLVVGGADLCNGGNSTGNFLQVGSAGAPSLLSMGTFTMGQGSNSFGGWISVTNATVISGSLRVGNSLFSSSNVCTVADGTVWNFTGFDLQIGRSGASSNLMAVTGGVITNLRSIGLGVLSAGAGAVANTLRITGGDINSGSLTIGTSSNDNFNAVLLGDGQLTVTGAVQVGGVSGGPTPALSNTLTIAGGKMLMSSLRVRATNFLSFAAGTLSTGATAVDNGANNGAPVVVGNGVNAASYELAAGDTGYHNFSHGLVITNAATLRGNGTVLGNLTVLGTISPGLSVGTITTSNNLVLGSSAVLAYELGASSDLIAVNGDLTLDGTINISDSGGFGIGDYTLITYTGALTDNGLAVGSTPDGSLTYTVDTSTAGSVILHVTSGGGDPYTTWASFYGLSGGNAAGNADPDGDGMSNTNEFLAGFNPTNSAAYLRIINVERIGSDIKVTYLGANGDSNGSPGPKTNVLEFTTGTGSGGYSNNFVSTGQTNILSGGSGVGVVTNMTDVGGASGGSRYYRVRVLTP